MFNTNRAYLKLSLFFLQRTDKQQQLGGDGSEQTTVRDGAQSHSKFCMRQQWVTSDG